MVNLDTREKLQYYRLPNLELTFLKTLNVQAAQLGTDEVFLHVRWTAVYCNPYRLDQPFS